MSKEYFTKLNYTLANEDTGFERSLILKRKARSILSICGSGGRVLPLLTETVDRVVATDLSPSQLALAKLRAELIEMLSYEDYLKFLGYPPYGVSANSAWRHGILLGLTSLLPEEKAFFLNHHDENSGEGLLYHGKWEKTFTGIPKFLRKFTGSSYDAVFEIKDFQEQVRFLEEKFADWKWLLIPRLVLRVFGNAAFFNAFLYRGHFVKKNFPETHFEYYRDSYRKAFATGLARENFFLELSFLGEIRHLEGAPIEAKKEVFESMKSELAKKKSLRWVQGDILSVAEEKEYQDAFDFVSLSDVPSYFSEGQSEVYLQRLKPSLKRGALVVVRCYLRAPERTNYDGFIQVTDRYRELIDLEKTQIYRIQLYEKVGS